MKEGVYSIVCHCRICLFLMRTLEHPTIVSRHSISVMSALVLPPTISSLVATVSGLLRYKSPIDNLTIVLWWMGCRFQGPTLEDGKLRLPSRTRRRNRLETHQLPHQRCCSHPVPNP